MANNVLITGGAGFIGSRLAMRMAACGARVGLFDNLLEQVHGPGADFPAVEGDVVCTRGDVRDAAALQAFVQSFKPDLVFHLAAETGTGQSLNEVSRYCDVNVLGTAHLIEAIKQPDMRVRRVVLASSRAVYGEGAYTDGQSIVVPAARQLKAMHRGQFEPTMTSHGALSPLPTAETTPPSPSSIYASTKLMQEYLLSQSAVDQDWSLTILRFQNVYGAGQSLRNPYTGVLSVFTKLLLSGGSLDVYEDGEITRDFVYVDDVVEALIRAGEADHAVSDPINIGTGEPITILSAARTLCALTGRHQIPLRVTGAFRPGDIRYAVADIARAGALLDWTPRISFAEGAERLVAWAKEQPAL